MYIDGMDLQAHARAWYYIVNMQHSSLLVAASYLELKLNLTIYDSFYFHLNTIHFHICLCLLFSFNFN
jgi:hypothetical protein